MYMVETCKTFSPIVLVDFVITVTVVCRTRGLWSVEGVDSCSLSSLRLV